MNKLPVIQGDKGDAPRKPIEGMNTLKSVAIARVLDLVSEGEIFGLVDGLKSVYLDETPIENADGSKNFTNYQVDHRYGLPNQDYIQGYPSVENELGINVQLKNTTPYERTFSNTNLNAVRVRLSVASLYKTNTDNGDVTGHRIDYGIELSTDNGPFVEVFNGNITGKTMSKYERDHRIELPPATEGWVIRVRRDTVNSEATGIGDDTYVESMVEIIDAKLRYSNSAIVGITLEAEQFASIPSRAYDLKGRIIRVPTNYDPETRAYTGVWDGTFKTAWTDNPAWIYYDLCTHTRYGLGSVITDQQINKWELYRIGQYCDQLVPDGNGGVEPRFTANLYLQKQGEAYKVIQDLATVFRAMAYWAGGEIVAVCDMPEDPVYTYTPANVIDGKFVYQGTAGKTRHTVALVSWNDPKNFGRSAVEYIDDEAAIARYGIQQTDVTAVGCSSQGQAQRLGRYILATGQYETQTVSFTVGLDGTLVSPGKIIRIADPLKAGKRFGGRIKSATTTEVIVDLIDPLIAAGDTLTVILSDGTAQTRTISSISGNAVTVSVAYTEAPAPETVWAADLLNVQTQRYRIISITENDELTYTVSAVQHVESKFDHVDLNTYIELPPVSTAVASTQAAPTNLILSQRETAGAILTSTVVTATWEPAPNAVAYEVQWRRDNGDWQKVPQISTTTIDLRDAWPGSYEVQVRAINANKIVSPALKSAAYPVVDQTKVPSVIADLQLSTFGNETAIAQEAIDRINGDTAEATARIDGLAQEALDRATAISAEATARSNAITEEADARALAVSNEAAARQAAINQEISDRIAATGETNLAVSALDTRVTNVEGDVTATSESVTLLANRIDHPSTGLDAKAAAAALDSLTTEVHDPVDGLGAKASAASVTALQAEVNNTTTGLPSKAAGTALTALEVRVTDVESVAFETTQLEARVDTVESSLINEMITRANKDSTTAAALNLLESRMDDPVTGLDAVASGLDVLETQVTNIDGTVTSHSNSLTSLQSQVNSMDTSTGGQGAAIAALDTRVTEAEGDIVSQGNAITSLQNSVTSANKTFIQPGQPPTTGRTAGDLWIDTDDNNKMYGMVGGVWTLVQDSGKNTIFVQGTQPTAKAVNDLWFDTSRDNRQFRWNGSAWVEISDLRVASTASALTSLTTRVTAAEGVNTSQGSAITTLQNTVNNATTGVTATANALSALETRVSSTETTNTSQGSAITSLQNTVNNATTGVTATASALSALTTRVTSAEGVNTSQGSAITSLQSTVNNGTTGVTATANAVSALTTRVTNAEGVNTSQASSITTLNTTVGNHQATITSYGTSINGLQAKAGVTIDVNGYITGWSLNNNGDSGEFIIVASKFKIVTPGQTPKVPFAVASGNVYINSDLYMGAGRIIADTGTHMRVQGTGFGTSNQFIEWYGPKMALTACSEANALSYHKTNGATMTGGTVQGAILSATALEQGSTRIHTSGGRLAPFTITDMGMQGRLTGTQSMTITLSDFIGPSNGTGYNHKRFAAQRMDVLLTANLHGDAAYETVNLEVQYDGGAWTMITNFRTECGYRGGSTMFVRYTTLDTWSTVAFRARTSESRTQSLAFKVEVQNYNQSGNTAGSTSGTASSTGGGGSAPAPEPYCVDYDTTVLSDGKYVRDLQVGDAVACWNEDAVNPIIEMRQVKWVKFGHEQSYTMVTESGVTIIQSASTPMTLRDGRIARTPHMIGEDVLVNRNGVMTWETVVGLVDEGVRKVVKVDLGDRMYFAGTDANATIATHNLQYKPL